MIRMFVPNQRVQSIYDIDLQALHNAGIRGIITDLDNTLVKTREPIADERVEAWFAKLLTEGFKVVIVSNNSHHRVSRFSHPLEIPYIHKARKPLRTGFRRSLRMLGLEAQQVAMVGDQLLTDVFGGNRMGMYTILVHPVSLEGEKMVTRFNRKIEKVAIRQLRKRGLFPTIEQKEDQA